MNWAIRRILQEHAAGRVTEATQELAGDLLHPGPRPAILASRRRRETKRERKKAAMAELRAKVMARAGGRGELSGQIAQDLVLCHLNGGIGRRTQKQWEGNCVADTPKTNVLIDSDPLGWLVPVQAWCLRHGHPLPERFRQLAALRGVEIPKP